MTSGNHVDHGWAWMVVIASHICIMIVEGLTKSLGIMLPTLRLQFQTNTGLLGSVLGLMGAVGGLAGKLISEIYSSLNCVKYISDQTFLRWRNDEILYHQDEL